MQHSFDVFSNVDESNGFKVLIGLMSSGGSKLDHDDTLLNIGHFFLEKEDKMMCVHNNNLSRRLLILRKECACVVCKIKDFHTSPTRTKLLVHKISFSQTSD